MTSKWSLAGKVHASSYRQRILIQLNESPKMPKQLSRALNTNLSHVSRALAQLEDLKLVECLSPELRKSKMYGITKLGKEVLKMLNQYK